MILSHGLEAARQARQHNPTLQRAAVVSIGVFDGVHLGHRAILEHNRARAQAHGAVSTIVTFAGHPKRVLLGRAPRTLTTLRHRLTLFRRLGVEHTLVLQFDEALRNMSAEDFLQDILRDTLQTQHFVLGFDSKFGKDRRGHAEFLQGQGEPVEVVERVSVRGRAVSSTAIREAVELGDLEGAATMLGRRVSIMGHVVHGDALGRTLGFPTANLNLEHELHPPPGVYAGFVRLVPKEAASGPKLAHRAMVNIGVRPSLQHAEPPVERVEVHLIGFEGDLYGQELEFEFVAPLRAEQAFRNLDLLRQQLQADESAALQALDQAEPDFGAPADFLSEG